MKNKVLIFCERSKKKGFGHYVRSVRLLRLLKKDKFPVRLYLNRTNYKIKQIIQNEKDFFFLVLDYKNYKTININKNNKIIKKFIFENLEKKYFFNSLNLDPLEIGNKNNCGPEYFLYPENFYYFKKKHIKLRWKNFKTINILIMQGGVDANDNIEKILKIFHDKKFKFNYKLFVKSSKKLPRRKITNKKIVNFTKVNLIENLYSKIHLAISACGNSCFELGFLGIPAIHITTEPREIIRAKQLKRYKLGNFYLINNEISIIKEINKFYFNNNYRNSLINRRINFFRRKNLLINLFKKTNYEKIKIR